MDENDQRDPDRPGLKDADDLPNPDEETAEFSSRASAPASAPAHAGRHVPVAELIEQASRLCEELVRFFPLLQTPEIRATHDPETIFLAIEGDGSGLLIGKKGQTLDALQYLLNRMVNRNLENPMRIELDTENYRSRRRGQLTALARKAADDVRASGRPMALEPMSPTERRIIHLALRDMPDVATESEGLAPDRFVVVRPRSASDRDDSDED
jgi:spoIIIJ-associated protein